MCALDPAELPDALPVDADDPVRFACGDQPLDHRAVTIVPQPGHIDYQRSALAEPDVGGVSGAPVPEGGNLVGDRSRVVEGGLRAEQILEVAEQMPGGFEEAPVATAGATAADVGLQQNDPHAHGALGQLVRGPEAREPATHDARICLEVGVQRRARFAWIRR